MPCSYVWRHAFGKTDLPVWLMPDGGSEEKLRAAVVHHLHAFMFWISYPVLWQNQKDFCASARIKPDRWEAWQCGRVTMQQEDYAVLLRMFGPARMPTTEQIDAETWRALRVLEVTEHVEYQAAKRIERLTHRSRTDVRTMIYTPLPLYADRGLSLEVMIRDAVGYVALQVRAADAYSPVSSTTPE